jgi:hypothetical protein
MIRRTFGCCLALAVLVGMVVAALVVYPIVKRDLPGWSSAIKREAGQVEASLKPTPSPAATDQTGGVSVVAVNPWGKGWQLTYTGETVRCYQSGTSYRANSAQCANATTTSSAGGGGTMDPCFSNSASPGEYACPEKPWGHVALVVESQGGHIQDGGPMPAGTPFGLELASGARCQMLQDGAAPGSGAVLPGATPPSLAPATLWYDCGPAGYLDGAPYRWKAGSPLFANVTIDGGETGTQERVVREWR